MESKRSSVLLVESSPVLQTGISGILSKHSEFRVLERISDIRFLGDACERFSPDIVMINPSMIDFRDRQSVKESLGLQNVRVVALVSVLMEEELLSQFDAVVSVFDSEANIVRKIRLASSVAEHTEERHDYDLSVREKEILVAVAKGKTNKEIADEFNLSVHTVITHRKNITQKTGIKSIAGLTVYAMLNNLISMDEI